MLVFFNHGAVCLRGSEHSSPTWHGPRQQHQDSLLDPNVRFSMIHSHFSLIDKKFAPD